MTQIRKSEGKILRPASIRRGRYPRLHPRLEKDLRYKEKGNNYPYPGFRQQWKKLLRGRMKRKIGHGLQRASELAQRVKRSLRHPCCTNNNPHLAHSGTAAETFYIPIKHPRRKQKREHAADARYNPNCTTRQCDIREPDFNP